MLWKNGTLYRAPVGRMLNPSFVQSYTLPLPLVCCSPLAGWGSRGTRTRWLVAGTSPLVTVSKAFPVLITSVRGRGGAGTHTPRAFWASRPGWGDACSSWKNLRRKLPIGGSACNSPMLKSLRRNAGQHLDRSTPRASLGI